MAPARGYFRSSAPGNSTHAGPSATFPHQTFRLAASWARKPGTSDAGSITKRSLLTLPLDGTLREIDVLDRQPQPRRDPQARAIERPRKQPMLAGHLALVSDHLIQDQHHLQAALTNGPPDVLHPRPLMTQYLALKEQQSRQGLSMTRYRQAAIHGEVRQKCCDFRPADRGKNLNS